MCVIINKTRIICALEERLNNNCKIILFNLKDDEIFHKLSISIKDKKENIEIWACADDTEKNLYSFVHVISRIEMNEIMDIYRLYEFTDKLIVLSDYRLYPGLMNYVYQNVLDEKTLITAITYKIE